MNNVAPRPTVRLRSTIRSAQWSANSRNTLPPFISYMVQQIQILSFSEDHLPATSPNLSANSDAGMAKARGFPNLY